jgi:hypothetical protein
MDWIQDQFSGRAADHWQRVEHEAARTATTSGIGPNIVLYWALRDMLLAYPATGVRAAILRRKAVDLPWNPKMTVETIQSTVVEYYESYDRAAALTRGGGHHVGRARAGLADAIDRDAGAFPPVGYGACYQLPGSIYVYVCLLDHPRLRGVTSSLWPQDGHWWTTSPAGC